MFSLCRQSVPLCKHIAVWAVFSRLPHACLGSIWLRLRRSMLPTLWHEVPLKHEFILWMCCCSGFFFLPTTSYHLLHAFALIKQLNMFCHKYICSDVCFGEHMYVDVELELCQRYVRSRPFLGFFLLFVPNASTWFSVENGWVGGTLSCILCAPRWTQSH